MSALWGLLRHHVTCLRRRFGMTYEEAEEVVDSALAECLVCIRRAHPEEHPDNLLTYLHPRFLQNVVKAHVADHYRNLLREQSAIRTLGAGYLPDDPEQKAMVELSAEEIWRALPSYCVEIVRLRVFEQCSWDEIARITGLSVSAVKMRYQRGVLQARAQLNGGCDEIHASDD